MKKRRLWIIGAGILIATVLLYGLLAFDNLVDFMFPFIDTRTESGMHLYFYLGNVIYPFLIVVGIFLFKLARYLWVGHFYDKSAKQSLLAETIIMCFTLVLLVSFWFLYRKTDYLATVQNAAMTSAYACAMGGLLPHSKWYKVGHDYIR